MTQGFYEALDVLTRKAPKHKLAADKAKSKESYASISNIEIKPAKIEEKSIESKVIKGLRMLNENSDNFEKVSGAYSTVYIGEDVVIKERKDTKMAQDYNETMKIMKAIEGIDGVPDAVMINGKIIEEKMPGKIVKNMEIDENDKRIIVEKINQITDEMKERGYLYLDYNTSNVLYDKESGKVSLVDYDPLLVTNTKDMLDKDDIEFEIEMFDVMRSEFPEKIKVKN